MAFIQDHYGAIDKNPAKDNQSDKKVQPLYGCPVEPAKKQKSKPKPEADPKSEPAYVDQLLESSPMQQQPIPQYALPYRDPYGNPIYAPRCNEVSTILPTNGFLKITGVEFVPEAWVIGGVYEVTTAERKCKAFLIDKSEKCLTFQTVNNDGKSDTFEIIASDMLGKDPRDMSDEPDRNWLTKWQQCANSHVSIRYVI
jgi:hypothetical protein